MPYGSRVLAGNGAFQEGDKMFMQFVYNDANGGISIGQPVCVDVTDAAEFNNLNATTALNPATNASGGKVVASTNANAGPCVGVYQPSNPNETPNNGDTIRVLVEGRGLISAQSPAAGAAGDVGSVLVKSAAVKDAVPGAAVAAGTIGIILATGAHVAQGAVVFAAASAVKTLVNGYVYLA